METTDRPPQPPFTPETAAQKVRLAEDAWNSRDPARVSLAYTADSKWRNRVEFIAERDSFYMATISETGWPYLQHRGGPPGFIRVLNDRTLAFADFRGNRQYISIGNLASNDRAALILVDYPSRRRLKIYAHVEARDLAGDPDLAAELTIPGYRAKVERALVLHLAAFDWNCPQHIPPRFSEAELAPALAPLRARLEALESENEALRARLAAKGG